MSETLSLPRPVRSIPRCVVYRLKSSRLKAIPPKSASLAAPNAAAMNRHTRFFGSALGRYARGGAQLFACCSMVGDLRTKAAIHCFEL